MLAGPNIATVSPLVGPEVIVAVVGGVLAILGGVGFWQYLTSRRKEPLDQKTTEAATAEQLGNLALSIARDAYGASEAAQKDAKAAREESAATRAHAVAQDAQIRRLTAGLQRFQAWGQYIVDNWTTVRMDPNPPVMPSVDTGPNRYAQRND